MSNGNTHIIAEMAWGHDGSTEQAIELVRAAKQSGADSISIHITSLPDYIVPYYGNGEGKVSAGREDLDVYQYLVDINPSNEDWEKINAVAKEIGLKVCVMPNDLVSLEFAETKLDPEYYVVPPASMAEFDMLEAIAQKNKPTLFRIGGSYLGEVETAINLFREKGNNQIILLHGFQNYPTALEETDMAVLKTLKTVFDVEVGLADHIDGGDELAKIIPILALPYGATYIEKHLTMDREKKSEDFESALDPQGFAQFVANVRAAEIAIGTPSYKNLNAASIRYRGIVRKRIVFAKPLSEGHVLSREDVVFKRCDIGITPEQVDNIIGRTLSSDVVVNEALTFDKLV